MSNFRIQSLYLQNVSYLFTALDRYEIFLDLTQTNAVINLFIGEMGSGKSVILGHLQPFATFGTLDSRNQDKMILPDVDGKKIIIYSKDEDEYIITHDYIWSGKNHTLKSSILKNGNELNPNGNQGSFKEIIFYEFGLDQNYLRLLRLGPNVTNFISMKSTERKSFVASLLASTDLYTFLYKKWNDENRDLNSKSNVLANKLNHIGADREEKLRDEYDSNLEDYQDLSTKYTSANQKLYQLTGERDAILNGKSMNDFYQTLQNLSHALENDKKECSEVIQNIHQYDNAPSIDEVTKILGRCDQIIETNHGRLIKLENDHSRLATDINILRDSINMSQFKDHVDTLESTYTDLQKQDMDYKRLLSNFQCEYTSNYLISFIGDLQMVDILIEELSQHNRDDITKIYKSDSSVIRWAQNKADMLAAVKYNLQKKINNIKFADKYEAPGIMYLPPFCPTKTCPYYHTHPYTLKKSQKYDDINEELISLQHQIEAADIDIYRYQEYGILYTKMSTLKELWKKTAKVLQSLKLLQSADLHLILTNITKRVWYSYDNLMQMVETCKKREQYYELTESLNKIKNELNLIRLAENSNSEEKLKEMQKNLIDISDEISMIELNNQETTADIKKYNQIYLDLSQLSIWKENQNRLLLSIQSQQEKLSKMEIDKETLINNLSLIQNIQTSQIIPLKDAIQKLVSRNEEIKSILNDIHYTKEEFDGVLKEKEYMKYMVDAVSSKEGIPLVMIETFLNDCKDIINELIFDVFEDDIEIQKFVIDEDEFRIPYIKNGILIDDVEKASQGQRSIISSALSFALIQKSEMIYNIILLDEVDGALYKADRNKFLAILYKQIKAIGSHQVFLISHNNTYEGYPVNIIMTTDEIVEKTDYNTIMKI